MSEEQKKKRFEKKKFFSFYVPLMKYEPTKISDAMKEFNRMYMELWRGFFRTKTE